MAAENAVAGNGSAQNVIARWQNRLDREYPDGAVCAWDRPVDDVQVIYVTSRIEVLEMAGIDPVMRIVPVDRSRVLTGRVTSYTDVPPGRWPPGTHRVTFAEYPGVMHWHPRVPAVLANRMPEIEPDEAGPGQQ